MAHIHLDEGSFPPWALALWTLVGAALYVYADRYRGLEDEAACDTASLACRSPTAVTFALTATMATPVPSVNATGRRSTKAVIDTTTPFDYVWGY
jgi:hypothetical protein